MVDVQAQLWIWDQDITSFMVTNAVLDSHSDLRFIFLCMEWSMHGTLWLILSSLGFLITMRCDFPLNTRYRLAVLTWGICVDLAIVGIIKGIVRRSRPPYDIKDQIYEAPLVDRFSFPSGHSSRSAMLAVLCVNLYSVPRLFIPLIKLFPFVLGASRIMIGRHYVSDVMAGLLLGYVEGNLVQYLPFSTINLLKHTLPMVFGEAEL